MDLCKLQGSFGGLLGLNYLDLEGCREACDEYRYVGESWKSWGKFMRVCEAAD